jgi:membrane protein implicated in regulation of membrane protease activity
MLVSQIIVFREAMEAGLIVGIILAATEGITGRGHWIAGGIAAEVAALVAASVAAGVAGASLVTAFAAALSVPAHRKFRLLVKNTGDTAGEFESTTLNREKLVPPGQTVTVFLGPPEPGEYPFFGDLHQDTAQGVLVAE